MITITIITTINNSMYIICVYLYLSLSLYIYIYIYIYIYTHIVTGNSIIY